MRRLHFDPRECPDHDGQPIGTCTKCPTEAAPKPANFRELLERSRRQHQEDDQ